MNTPMHADHDHDHDTNTTIDAIVALEWHAFDAVQNEGGRASCQDDFDTFQIMRKSQFLAWDASTRAAYLADLREAERFGRNLVQEKYARMMASTAPRQYAGFAHQLPPLSPWQRTTIEEICRQQVQWRIDFGQAFPFLASQARLIRSEEDTANETSFETYLRGELGTYSETTLRAYRQLISSYQARGENLTQVTMAHTTRLYGYAGLEAAEERLKEQVAKS